MRYIQRKSGVWLSGMALLLGWTATVHAQSPAQALVEEESVQALVRQSLDCLRRGEEASDPEASMALFREGLRHAEAAVEADEACADAHFAAFANRGRILVLQGAVPNPFNLYAVQRELNRTLELNPAHGDGLAAKGAMLRQMPRFLGGNLQEAKRYLLRSLEVDPNALNPRLELAKVHQELGEPERGIAILEEAAELARRGQKTQILAEIQAQLSTLRSP